MGRRSRSQPTGARSTTKPRAAATQPGIAVPIVGVVDRPVRTVAECFLHRVAVPGDVVEGTVRVERQHQSFAGGAQLAGRAVEGRQGDPLNRCVEPVTGKLVGVGGAGILGDELAGLGPAGDLGRRRPRDRPRRPRRYRPSTTCAGGPSRPTQPDAGRLVAAPRPPRAGRPRRPTRRRWRTPGGTTA